MSYQHAMAWRLSYQHASRCGCRLSMLLLNCCAPSGSGNDKSALPPEMCSDRDGSMLMLGKRVKGMYGC